MVKRVRTFVLAASLAGLVLALPGPARAETLTLQPGPVEGKDTYTLNYHATTNYGDSSIMTVRSRYNSRRGFIEFDLSSIPSGPCVTITDASLELHLYECNFVPGGDPPYGDGQTNVNVYRITMPWTEGTGGTVVDPGPYDPNLPLIWSNQPLYDSTIIDTALCTKAEVPAWKTWDVTGLVSDWQEGVYPNYGVALYSVSDGDWANFITSDNTTQRPRLVVTYRVPEPSTLILLLLGTAGLFACARRRRR